jgi:hypothetical protein
MVKQVLIFVKKSTDMTKKKTTPPESTEKPRVHKDLDGFDIRINSFGEITSTIDIDKINQFLNKHVDDKKLRSRDDLNENPEE